MVDHSLSFNAPAAIGPPIIAPGLAGSPSQSHKPRELGLPWRADTVHETFIAVQAIAMNGDERGAGDGTRTRDIQLGRNGILFEIEVAETTDWRPLFNVLIPG